MKMWTNAVGLITARDGIKVGSGITLSVDGDGFFTGIITAMFLVMVLDWLVLQIQMLYFQTR